jgi:hypothetical protein
MTVNRAEPELAQILPRFRTRAELYRWGPVRAYAGEASEGVTALREAADRLGARPVIPYVQRALSSTIRVILRADDSHGVIGDVVWQLLGLHAELCAADPPPPAKLVRWLISLQFDGTQDFFEPDIVRYADALGPDGIRRYRRELDRIAEQLPPEPSAEEERSVLLDHTSDRGRREELSRARHARFLLRHNAQRLAVAERDVDQIIAQYGGDQTRAYRLHDVAKALAEIGEVNRAIDFARRATLLESSHQGQQAGSYWCNLLAEHRPEKLLAARRTVFDRWPSSSNATYLFRAAESSWPELEPSVLTRLADRPYDYVVFVLLTLEDVPRAWTAAHDLGLAEEQLWTRLVEAYEATDPAAVVPVLRRLVESDLSVADARNYRTAARRLRRLRDLSAGLGRAEEAQGYVDELRQRHRNRPRFLTELDRAGLR